MKNIQIEKLSNSYTIRRLTDADVSMLYAWMPVSYTHLDVYKRQALADLVRSSAEAEKIGRLHSKATDFSSLCREKIQPMGLAFTAKAVVI